MGLLLITALVAVAFAQDDDASAVDLTALPPAPAKAVVASVYDGDTMTLATGDKVRLRWANTPELRPLEEYGVEAREATKTLCLNQEATLTYGQTQRDSYGRLLAGVECQGQDLSLHLLELGLGHVFLIPPDDRDPGPLLEAQDRARTAKRGIWSTERYQGTFHFTSFHANADGDDRSNVNGEYLRTCNISSEVVDLAGYKITNIAGRSFTLPTVLVPPGHTFKLVSGVGEQQTNPDEQLEVYLGSADPIWNNERDRATLYDRHGRVVDSRTHETKGPPRP